MRARKACLPCATRKRKCDGALPCDVCTGYGYECRYRHNSNRLRPASVQVRSSLQSSYLDGPVVNEQAPSLLTPPGLPQLPKQPEQVNESNNGLLVVSSSTYLGRHSAQAFPRFLGLQMQAQVLPKLQPFAWNMGVGLKPVLKARNALSSLITLDETKKQLRSFFRSNFPASSFLNLHLLISRCEKHWVGHDQGLPFEALICGIIGLVSVLCSTIESRRESDLMDHAETVLNDHTILADANVEVLAAVLLRSLYLRATATPQITWLTSCTAMHMAESLGLHKQYNSTAKRERILDTEWNDEVRSLIFWIVCAGNRLFSHELGRTPVILHDVTTEFPFRPSDSSAAATLCRLCCLLPLGDINKVSDDDQKSFSDSIETIAITHCDQPFLKLIAAEVCFTMYRRIRVSSHQHMTRQELQQVVLIGREAVQAANQLLEKGRPWWNMVSTLFQFCCVLISIDSTDSLPDLKHAMKTIYLIRDHYPSDSIIQALSTLKALIAAARQRKEVEMAYLTTSEETEALATNSSNSVPFGATDFTSLDSCFDNVNWSIEDLDWMSVEVPLARYDEPETSYII
jgi:hypothetical protein